MPTAKGSGNFLATPNLDPLSMGISNEMPCALASNENERLREVRNVGPFPTFTHDRRRDAALAPHRDFSDATTYSGATTKSASMHL